MPIDYYVAVDVDGFVALVDELGGIEFDVPVRMSFDDPTQDLHIHYQPGLQHLTGEDVLKVARCRNNSDGPGSYPDNLYGLSGRRHRPHPHPAAAHRRHPEKPCPIRRRSTLT